MNGYQQEDWGPPRQRALLAVLLLHPGRSISATTMIEWVWPDEEPLPQHASATFHNYATRIRKSLQLLSSPPELQFTRGFFRLDVDRLSIDYHLFRNLMAEARQHHRAGDPQATVRRSVEAFALWRGTPLSDLTSASAVAWRLRVVHDEWIPGQVILLQALVDMGDLDEALMRLDDLQADHPFDVRLGTLRLTMLHRLARYTDVTSYYLTLRRQLLDNVDQQAADHLRRHHDALTVGVPPSPPDRDVVVQPHQLPHDVPDFVGRTDLLAALDAAATTTAGECTSGVVLLDGMAGVGKSALAVRWSHQNLDRFPGGNLYVNLAGFSSGPRISAAAVIDDMLMALGQHVTDGASTRAKEVLLSRLLGRRRILVVLDNAADAAQVQDLLPTLSSCYVIVTSRQHLGAITATTGARRIRVEPLRDTDTVDLFNRRLSRRPDLDPDPLLRIASLCAGVPFAAVILAEHIATRPNISLVEFAHNLDQQQLVNHLGDSGEGSGALQTAFAWSYRALPTATQRLFRLLGLHPGPDISVEAANAVDGRTPADTGRSLNLLVGAHLLEQPNTMTRYRFHDLMAVHATHQARVDEPEHSRQDAQLRYLSFYLASATQANRAAYPSQLEASELPVEDTIAPLTFDTPADAIRWLGRERVNLVAAVAADTSHHARAWRLADVVSAYLDRHGRSLDSRTVRQSAVNHARHAGDIVGATSSLVGLGMVHIALGDHEAARECLDEALLLTQREGFERGQSASLYHLAHLEFQRGDLAAAIPLFERSLEIGRRIDDYIGVSWAHCSLAEALRRSGRTGEAVVHLNSALWLAQQTGDRSAEAKTLAELGSAYRAQGHSQMAVTYCEQALDIADSIPDYAVTAHASLALAEIMASQLHTDAAVAHAQRAIDLCHRTHSPVDEARAHDVLGDAYQAAARITEAIGAWARAATLYVGVGNNALAAEINTKINSSM